MQETKTIDLIFPVTTKAGKEIKSVTIRRPLALDMIASRNVSENPAEQTAALVVNLCMLAPEDLEELDGKDFARINNIIDKLTEFNAVEDYKPGDPIPLTQPVEIDGGTKISTLPMRRPKVRDMKAANLAAPDDSVAEECHLFAALAGVKVDVIQRLDYADYRKIKKVYSGFLQ